MTELCAVLRFSTLFRRILFHFHDLFDKCAADFCSALLNDSEHLVDERTRYLVQLSSAWLALSTPSRFVLISITVERQLYCPHYGSTVMTLQGHSFDNIGRITRRLSPLS